MSDLASFNPQHINVIHGEYPECLITAMTIGVECHHILGRGGKHNRKLMSSIFNCAPLESAIHARGYINHYYFQQFLLDLAYKKVQHKVLLKEYTLTRNDLDFLRKFPTPPIQ